MNNKEIKNGSKVLLPAVFSSADDKKDKFLNELKALLVKYDAELELENFGRDWQTEENMVVNFKWDEELANRTNNGIVPQIIIGTYENGR
jgi:hypothetical protein